MLRGGELGSARSDTQQRRLPKHTVAKCVSTKKRKEKPVKLTLTARRAAADTSHIAITTSSNNQLIKAHGGNCVIIMDERIRDALSGWKL